MVSIGLAMVAIGWAMDGTVKSAGGLQQISTNYSAQILHVSGISEATVEAPPRTSGMSMFFGAILLSMAPLVSAILTEIEKYQWHQIEYLD